MASASALYGSAGLAVYSATKYGIRGLSEALDVEWGPSGIKVRCLFPSFVDTPMLAGTPGSSEDSKRDRVLRSEEHTSELQSLMRTSYAVFCLKKKKTKK